MLKPEGRVKLSLQAKQQPTLNLGILPVKPLLPEIVFVPQHHAGFLGFFARTTIAVPPPSTAIATILAALHRQWASPQHHPPCNQCEVLVYHSAPANTLQQTNGMNVPLLRLTTT
jgi:hypothetical protein